MLDFVRWALTENVQEKRDKISQHPNLINESFTMINTAYNRAKIRHALVLRNGLLPEAKNRQF